MLWSVDPAVIRDAALLCAQITRTLSPDLGRLVDDVPAAAPPASADLHRATGLFNRMAHYLDKPDGR